MKHKLLLDLWFSFYTGYCGIAQDNRLMLKLFSNAEKIDVSGLLYSNGSNAFRRNYKKNASYDELLMQTTIFFHSMLGAEVLSNNTFRQYFQKLRKIKNLYSLCTKTQFDTYPIDDVFNNVIWRNGLTQTLLADDRENVMKNRFYFSDMTIKNIITNNLTFNRNVCLDTKGYDFMLFSDVRPITVSPGTTKIIRYHDAIPILDPDVTVLNYSELHFRALKSCQKDSFFVCNSESTRADLIKIFPKLESRSTTIPYSLPTNYVRTMNAEMLMQIIEKRLSTKILDDKKSLAVLSKLKKNPEMNYILCLATLEPRKNYISLIRAWEKLIAYKDKKLKLIIVANAGWKSEAILHAMRPHILSGDLIHLEQLTPEEIPYLYSHAKAFIFPSYNEGFGFPPMEAMQCGCPTIVSDIAAHRWVMGDASLYCDPYDINSIYDAINQLIYGANSFALQSVLVEKGYQQIKRYSLNEVEMQWNALLDNLKAHPL